MPLWFEYIVVVGCSGVISFGGFGLLLAVAGNYSAGPALLLGAVGTVACTFLARPVGSPSPARATPGVTLPAVGMCVVAATVAVWNSILIGHNVVVATDPGVYLVAGRWLASHGSLIVPAGHPWSGTTANITTVSAGMYQMPNGTLQFQFAHLLAALLAEAHGVGGDALMFRVPALLNAVGLCAVYATGCRLIRRPWLTLAAVTALAVALPQLYFSRDTFSESATQVLLWGGIWLLLRAYETRRVTVAVVAGLAIGGTLMTRIDAVAYLIPVPLLAAAGWLAAHSPDDRRSLLRVYTAVLAGALPPAVLGTIDVQRRSTLYYVVLRNETLELYILLAASMVAAVVMVLALGGPSRLASWLYIQRNRISIGAAWVIGLVFLVAWSLRPAGPTTSEGGAVGIGIAAVQKSEGLPVHPETYAEHTVQWISWYIGPVAVILAIVGLCLLTVLAIRRGWPAAVVVLAMAGPLTILYLWNPNVTPTQIWAMRRFVPASLPALLLAAGAAVDIAATASGRLFRGSAWPRRVAAVGAAGMIAFPLGTTLPVARFQVQANFLPVVERMCQVVGPNGAMLFPYGDYDGLVLMQTVRSWCNVPAARLLSPATSPQLSAMAASMRAQGRTLWVVGTATLIRQTDPALTPALIGKGTSPRELEQTVDRPPQHYSQSVLTVSGAKVP